MSNSHSNYAYTKSYVLGEDPERLHRAARELGLTTRRSTMAPVRRLFQNDSQAALQMHSVGVLGVNERVDASGTLHTLTIRRRHRPRQATWHTTAADKPIKPPDYGSLTGLFQVPLGEQHVAAEGDPDSTPDNVNEEEADEEEEIIEDKVEGGSLQAAMFGILKGTVGPAILYLPHGFQTSGYAVAIPAMLFATFMFIYNAYRLLDCWKVESDRNHALAARVEEVRVLLEQPRESSFSPALLTYSELARRALGRYAVLVELGIALMQFGVCLTYLIFVPQNLQECAVAVTGQLIPKTVFLVIMLVLEIPLCWIQDIRKLTPTNVIATLLIGYGLCSVLVLALARGFSTSSSSNTGELIFAENLATLPVWTDTWFVFVGTSFFMMEGSITLLVPLQEAVYADSDKAKFPRANQIVTTWIVVFYIVFSVICVLSFGDGIRTAMTASLKGYLATTVQFAYSVAVILTFPLQAFPAMQVASRAILTAPKKRGNAIADRNKEVLEKNILATVLILLLGMIAVVAIDYLGNVVSILGSLFGIPLALVFPPLMHNSLLPDSSRTTKWMNYSVVLVGFLAMAAASFATIVSWDKGAEGG